MKTLFGRWARTETAISIASCFAVLTCSAVFLALGANDAAAVAVMGLIMILAGRRQVEQIRRGKEILNRYRPERNPRPLGL